MRVLRRVRARLRLQRAIAADLERHVAQLVPGLKQQIGALLRREPPDKECVAAVGRAHPGIVRNEVRLHVQPLRRKFRLQKQCAIKLTRQNVAIHLPMKRAPVIVYAKHRRHHRALRTRAAIAAVQRARPWDCLPKTILADAAVAIVIRLRTEQARVVQRLDHWHTRTLARVVRRGRNQRKRVVEVRHVGPMPPQQLRKRGITVPRPRGAERERCLAQRRVEPDLIVVADVFARLVAAALQQVALAGEDIVFPAVLAIVVVD